MELADEETGRLQRNESKYESRYSNLNRSSHNYLRISRIMKSLIEFGLDDYPAAFIMFVLHEQSEKQVRLLAFPEQRLMLDSNSPRKPSCRQWTVGGLTAIATRRNERYVYIKILARS